MKTQTDQIRELLAQDLKSGEIALLIGCRSSRVSEVRWSDRHPGYHAQHMRKYRRERDKEYRAQERDRQKSKYRRDADYRKRRVESSRRFREKQREARP